MTTARRPAKDVAGLETQQFTVASGQTVHAGMPIVMAATDTSPATADAPQAQEAVADTTIPIAIAYSDDPDKTWTAGQVFDGLLLSGYGKIPVLVGTNTVTRGSRIVAESDGFKNAPAHGTGSRIFSPGIALETGAAGDFVSMLLQPMGLSKA